MRERAFAVAWLSLMAARWFGWSSGEGVAARLDPVAELRHSVAVEFCEVAGAARHGHHQVQQRPLHECAAAHGEVGVGGCESEPFDQPVAVDGEVLGREERRNLVNRGGVGCEVDAEWTGDVLAVDDDLSEHGGIVLGGYDRAGHQAAESLRSLIRGV